MLKNALRYSHELLSNFIVPGDTVVDATVGNGNDTVLLAKLVGSTGHVIGFDIQQQAIETTKEKLLLTGLLHQTTLYPFGHEKLDTVIPENNPISAAIFNLGYLPSGDKNITTQSHTTLSALEQLLQRLRKGGIVVVVIYWGHESGNDEKNALMNWLPTLSQEEYSVLSYSFLNQKNNPPFLIAIEKK